MNRHLNLVYKVASVYTTNADDKNDLVQDILYQAWKSFDSFRQESKISTWLYRVAMNVAIYQVKTRKRNIEAIPLTDQNSNLTEDNSNGTEEQWQRILFYINRLNLLDKGIVLLYLENKSHEEIAEITGLSVSNVGTKLSRIKEKLRQQVTKS
ncbi:MAG: RNA polymerase sigma factor [Bacteroidetes bacterium]|nr:RNA polymerase sigma factor [Bacteroidota bacterium]